MGLALTDSEMEQLADLGTRIKGGLDCDLNDTGVPCRTDRFAVVEAMIEYLTIHDYKVVEAP